MKHCIACHQDRPIKFFPTYAGRRNICRRCLSHRKWLRENGLPVADLRRLNAPRFPLGPLLYACLRERYRDMTDSEVADYLTDRGFPVGKRTIEEWRKIGIPDASADRVSIACGWHPGNVWGDDWWAVGLAIPEQEEVA